jgi:predicted TIM-barrel fold metal-dependent hydrolase
MIKGCGLGRKGFCRQQATQGSERVDVAMAIYSGPIVDPHMHLWDMAMDTHAWLRSADGSVNPIKGLEKLRSNWLVEDYRRASQSQPIVGTVHIEANWDPSDPLGETSWLDTLDKESGVAARYIAAAPFGTEAAASLIERQAQNPRVAGFRSIVSFHPTRPEKSWVRSPDILASEAWRRDVSLLAERGLILELMLYPYQAEGAVAVAEAFPDLQIVLNHCASPIDQDEDGLVRWRAALERLAKPENVALKVNMVGYNPNPTFESVQATALDCIECFGPERTMFATDWPVASRFTSFDGIYDTFRRIVAPMPDEAQKSMFHDTAARIYALDGLLSSAGRQVGQPPSS